MKKTETGTILDFYKSLKRGDIYRDARSSSMIYIFISFERDDGDGNYQSNEYQINTRSKRAAIMIPYTITRSFASSVNDILSRV